MLRVFVHFFDTNVFIETEIDTKVARDKGHKGHNDTNNITSRYPYLFRGDAPREEGASPQQRYVLVSVSVSVSISINEFTGHLSRGEVACYGGKWPLKHPHLYDEV